MEASNTSQADSGGAWTGLLSSVGQRLVPILITAGSLIGFVAFAGAVIVWTRFFAAKVPPDQAVNAVPRDELVAIGSSLLLLFGFFGAIAVIAIYLIDRGGRTSPGMSRGLVVLLAVEGLAAILLAKNSSVARTVLAVELFLLAMAVILWATYVDLFTKLNASALPERGRGELDAVLEEGPFRSPGHGWASGMPWSLLAVNLAGFALGAGLIVHAIWTSALTACAVGVGALGLAFGAAVATRAFTFYRDQARRTAEEEGEGRGIEEALLAQVLADLGFEPDAPEEAPRKPPQFELSRSGAIVVGLLLVLAVVGPYLLLHRHWSLAASLASAMLITAALWRIASLAAPRFMWYGLAIFISVPLFGTLTAMARNLEDPQVQPMALIRSTDGPDEAIQGLYVTETSDRVYFATVASEGCSNHLASHSGRLLWVPKAEVVAMSVGPAQDVKDAANTATEMAYALTPGIGAPSAGAATLSVAAEQASAKKAEPAEAKLDKRLEDVGPAVRPDFGRGLTLVPPEAAPGKLVTLRMSAPNKNVHGFGRKPNGRTIRLNGLPVAIERERAGGGEAPEYVETETGAILTLDKKGLHGGAGEGGEEPHVQLEDESVAEVVGAKEGKPMALAVASRSGGRGLHGQEQGFEELAPGQEVKLKTGETVGLRTVLLRQAWHPDWVRFRVPQNASTGLISVDCEQLAGEPLLQVNHAPEARITVRMQAGSERVGFDSSNSEGEAGQTLSRRWTIAGISHSHGTRASADLPPRLSSYSVALTVTDEAGRQDTARLHLLRLPASLFALDSPKPENTDAIKRAGEALLRTVENEPPAAIEIDGNADDTGGAHYNMVLSLKRAENVREALLQSSTKKEAGGGAAGGPTIPVTTLAYGEGCPLDRRGGPRPRNRRVDVFVIYSGVRVAPPRGCHPGRFLSSSWHLP